jgi:hypothetical protein
MAVLFPGKEVENSLILLKIKGPATGRGIWHKPVAAMNPLDS